MFALSGSPPSSLYYHWLEQDLFHLFDKDGTGNVNFVEFVYGLALLTPGCSFEDRKRLAFSLYDRCILVVCIFRDGGITYSHLTARHPSLLDCYMLHSSQHIPSVDFAEATPAQ